MRFDAWFSHVTAADRAAMALGRCPRAVTGCDCGAQYCRRYDDIETAREMREQAEARQEARDRAGSQYGDGE